MLKSQDPHMTAEIRCFYRGQLTVDRHGVRRTSVDGGPHGSSRKLDRKPRRLWRAIWRPGPSHRGVTKAMPEAQLFWEPLDHLAYAVMDARLWLFELLHGSQPPTPADQKREADNPPLLVSCVSFLHF